MPFMCDECALLERANESMLFVWWPDSDFVTIASYDHGRQMQKTTMNKADGRQLWTELVKEGFENVRSGITNCIPDMLEDLQVAEK